MQASRFTSLSRSPVWRRRALSVGHALLLAIVGLGIHLAWYPIGNVGVETDFYGDIGPAARKLLEGRFQVTDYPFKGPVISFLLAPLYQITGDWYRSGVLLNLAAAAGCILLLYHLLRRLYDGKTAFASVLLLTLTYSFFIDAHKATSDLLFMFLSLLSIDLLLHESGRSRQTVLAGLAGGLAFLTRYNGVFLLGGTTLAVLLANPRRETLRRRGRAILPYLLGFAAVAVPWMVLSMAETRSVLFNRSFQNIGMAFYWHKEGRDLLDGRFTSLGSLWRDNPLRFLLEYVRKLPLHFWMDLRFVLGPVAGPLLLLGLVRVALVRPTRAQGAFYIILLSYGALMGIWFYLPRFFVLMLAAYYPIVFSFFFAKDGPPEGRPDEGSGWRDRLRRWLPSASLPAKVRVRAGWAALVLTGGVALFQVASIERANLAERPLYLLPAAEFLKKSDTRAPESGSRLMARRPHLAFLSGMEYQRFPDRALSYGELLRMLRESQTGVLAFGPEEEQGHPNLAFLAVADSLPGLVQEYRSTDLSLYRVLSSASAPGAEADELADEETLRLQEAVRKGEREGQVSRVLSAGGELVTRLVDQGRLPQARLWGQRCLACLQARGATSEEIPKVCYFRNLMAMVRLRLGEADEAAVLLDQNLRALRGGREPGLLANTAELMGLRLELLGRIREAAQFYEEALRNHLSAGDTAAARETSEKLGQVRRGGGVPSDQ